MVRDSFKTELLPLLLPTGALCGNNRETIEQLENVLNMAKSSSEILICLIALYKTNVSTLQACAGVALPILEKWLIEANQNNHIELQQKILECVDLLPVTRPLLMEAGSLVKLLKKLRKQKYMRNRRIRKIALKVYSNFEQLFGHKRKIEEEEDEEVDEDYFIYNAKDNDTCRGIVALFKNKYDFDIDLDELLKNNDWCKGLTPSARLQRNTTIYIPSTGGQDPRTSESGISRPKRFSNIEEEFSILKHSTPKEESRTNINDLQLKSYDILQTKRRKLSTVEKRKIVEVESSNSIELVNEAQSRRSEDKVLEGKKTISRGMLAAALKKPPTKASPKLPTKFKTALHREVRSTLGRVKLLEPTSTCTSKNIGEENKWSKRRTKEVKSIACDMVTPANALINKRSVTWACQLEHVRYIEPRPNKSRDVEVQREYQKELEGAKALSSHTVPTKTLKPSMGWRLPPRILFPNYFDFSLERGSSSEERYVQERRESQNLAMQYFVEDKPASAKEPTTPNTIPSPGHVTISIAETDLKCPQELLTSRIKLESLIAEAESKKRLHDNVFSDVVMNDLSVSTHTRDSHYSSRTQRLDGASMKYSSFQYRNYDLPRLHK